MPDAGPKNGFSGGPAVVRDSETNEPVVFGIFVGETTIGPFAGTSLSRLLGRKVGVIRRIPEHLLVDVE
jgi:hypothetical protein